MLENVKKPWVCDRMFPQERKSDKMKINQLDVKRPLNISLFLLHMSLQAEAIMTL